MMVRGIGLRDNMRLFISDHKLLCKLCSYRSYVKLKMGLNRSLRNQIEQTLDVFLDQGEKKRGGTGDVSSWICFTAVIAT